MSGAHWLAPVVAALDATMTPVPWFFRDDDAGWADDALWALLDVFAGADVPVDVAAIPTAVTPACGRQLSRRTAGGTVRVHQHGYAHVDHGTDARKSEFGAGRDGRLQFADIVAGRVRLEDRLGQCIDPVFTPPWNRCGPQIAGAVLAAGHTVLSRDVSAGLLDHPGLIEVPVAVDWSGHRHGAIDPRRTGHDIAARIASGAPVGVMLHHAVMDVVARRRLGELLAVVNASEHARPTHIVALAASGGGPETGG